MKKCLVFVFAAMAIVSVDAFAQGSDPSVLTAADGRTTKRHFKPANPENDKTDRFDISAISATTFTTSNNADGSANSYKHSQKIVVALQAAGKANAVQLVFYSVNAEMPYAAGEDKGVISVYFPISMYGEIREKLETALAGRKKVQVQVMQGKEGYREGILLL